MKSFSNLVATTFSLFSSSTTTLPLLSHRITPSSSFILQSTTVGGFDHVAAESNRYYCSSSSSKTMDDDESPRTTPRTLRVLALHGSGGDAIEFPKRLERLKRALQINDNDDTSFPIQLEITTVQGPFDKDTGYCWWTMVSKSILYRRSRGYYFYAIYSTYISILPLHYYIAIRCAIIQCKGIYWI
jgi:hypothetical protein